MKPIEELRQTDIKRDVGIAINFVATPEERAEAALNMLNELGLVLMPRDITAGLEKEIGFTFATNLYSRIVKKFQAQLESKSDE